MQAVPSDNYYKRRSYRLREFGPGEPTANDRGTMLEDLRLTSAITSPAPGTRLRPGRIEVRGWTIGCGEGRVERVELSADDGVIWREARLMDDDLSPWSWRLWRAEVDAAPGTVL